MTAQKPNPSATSVLMRSASEIKHWPVQWLWRGRIARAKLTFISGATGSGKSALAVSLAAAVSTGGAWPCGEGDAPKGSAILVCPGGDPDVFMPRLKAAGADLSHVKVICEVDAPNGPRPFDAVTDLPLLDVALRTVEDLRLIVVDGLNLSAGRGAARQARTLLDPLAALAKSHDIPVVAIARPAGDGLGRKRPGIDPLTLEAAPCAFVIETDPADESRRLLLQVKNELAPEPGTLGFRVAAHALQQDQTAARIVFEPHHDPITARQFFARQSRSFDSAKHEAIGFLHDLFAGASELTIRQIEDAARGIGLIKASQGLAQCRVLRDARLAMGLAVTRATSGVDWVWAKPDRQETKGAQLATQARPAAGQNIQTAAVASPSLQPKQMPERWSIAAKPSK